LKAAGFEVYGHDLDPGVREHAKASGITAVPTLQALVSALQAPRRIFLSLPAGEATSATLAALCPLLGKGDLICDCANARHEESRARAKALSGLGLQLVDAGVSGGVLGAAEGYAVMAGGTEEAITLARPLLESLAQKDGFLHTGPPGSGHFVKTVHNAIEYGMMQSMAEGFELLSKSPDYPLELPKIAALFNHGAVIRSQLMKLAAQSLAEDAALASYSGKVGDNGTGRWAAEAAASLGVDMPALQAALAARQKSQTKPSFASRLLSALRRKFGGHRETH
jgi:6-phosphogluconate dehydrogenase